MLEAARAAPGRRAWTWSSATSRRTAAPETEALLAGLEIAAAPQASSTAASTLPEFDLDAALARRPAAGRWSMSWRTPTRPARATPSAGRTSRSCWTPGIDVYTTLNVQHLESLNDVVAQITGVVVRETVPDCVLDEADEVELVDLPPEELLQRLREGKVYVPEQAERAVDELLPQGQPDRPARAGPAPRRRARRRRRCRPTCETHAIAGAVAGRASGCWSASAPARWRERLVRAARRMAAGLRARVDRGLRRDAARARLSDRRPRAGGAAPCAWPSSWAREAVTLHRRHASARRLLAYAREPQRHQDRRRQADAPALARPPARLGAGRR